MAKIFQYTKPRSAVTKILTKAKKSTVLFHGRCLDLVEKLPDNSIDCTICSPPYCIGKSYEDSRSIADFVAAQREILPAMARITKPGGSICWQVGYHLGGDGMYPLDYIVFAILSRIEGITLQGRIVWTYGHGTHAKRRFSGRHETILWFTKGHGEYTFNLDAVRVPQKYPGKRHYKGPNKGQFSGNPNGKNPGDVWDIPNVKGKHIEKLAHPCQFPVGLAERLVRALSPKNGVIFDPYMGTSSTGVAAVVNGRRFLGAEIRKRYMNIAVKRLRQAHAGTVSYRSADKPVLVPPQNSAVSKRPAHFKEPKQ